MNEDLFFRITNSGHIGTALLIIAVGVWIIASRMLDKSQKTHKSSR